MIKKNRPYKNKTTKIVLAKNMKESDHLCDWRILG